MVSFFPSFLIYALLLGSAKGFSASVTNQESSMAAAIVTVKNGTYAGVHSSEYNQDFFLGMRYAQPAVRFAVAEPLNSTWAGVRNATEYQPFCYGFGPDSIGFPLSEDCLYINLVRPAGISETSRLPVMVWIHGGGLYMGGSEDPRWNLTFIVQNSIELGTPIIGITISYRLAAFGFLGSKEAKDAGIANLGFRDQRHALRWVNENVAAFGGSPDKVTIYGESGGAESVNNQVLAYNGRDDKLFRGAIADSGFGGVGFRFAGGYNNTKEPQEVYNTLVTNTSCAPYLNTSESLSCLRDLPIDEIAPVINATNSGVWAPVKDDDFISNWPHYQFSQGLFPKIPILIGVNTDEGSQFGANRGLNGGGINTDEEMASAMSSTIGAQAPDLTGKSMQELIDEALDMYPNIQAIGIPDLETYPEVIHPNSTVGNSLGIQTRRSCAYFGDLYIHYLRRRASISWSKFGLRSYAYRFNVTVNGEPAYIGSTHFSEVAFVFDNVKGIGYKVNPFANEPATYPKLAKIMSKAWISFVVKQDPNWDGLGVQWPVYNASAGGGVGEGIVFSANKSPYIEYDSYRAEPMNWFIENSLPVFGN